MISTIKPEKPEKPKKPVTIKPEKPKRVKPEKPTGGRSYASGCAPEEFILWSNCVGEN